MWLLLSDQVSGILLQWQQEITTEAKHHQLRKMSFRFEGNQCPLIILPSLMLCCLCLLFKQNMSLKCRKIHMNCEAEAFQIAGESSCFVYAIAVKDNYLDPKAKCQVLVTAVRP